MVRRKIFFLIFLIFPLVLLVTIFEYQPRPDYNKPTIAVVFGYHFLLEKNSAQKQYVGKIKSTLDSFADIRLIVVSGTKTKPESSRFSEAKNVELELRRQGITAPIVLEERSRSTKQNVEFSEAVLHGAGLPHGTQVVIFADKLRRPSIWLYLKNHFADFRTFVFGIPLWRERLSYAEEMRVMRYRDKYDIHNFAAVEPKKIYRSAQPSPQFLQKLVAQYGIKTVVNLRGETLGSEKIAAEKLGLQIVEIPLSPDRPPSESEIARFLSVVTDNKSQPVLVHCKNGSDRTGILVAFYRIRKQKWCREKALNEMSLYGYLKFVHPEIIGTLSEDKKCTQ